MSPFGWHPLHLVGNTDTLSEGPALTRGSVGFLDFFFVFVPCKVYILVSFGTLVVACLTFVTLVLIGCIVSFSSKRNFSWSCLMLLVLSSFFPTIWSCTEPKLFIFCHFRIQKLRKFAKFCFLLSILILLHLQIGRKNHFWYIYCSFPLNVIILWLKNFKPLIRFLVKIN